MSYLGRRPAALAIRAYRRWGSGRGPLRRVRCTFAATESCSAYGLRVVDELATSLPHAVSLVRARVRACRHASVYRFGDIGFGWERDHDREPAELARALAARGERHDTIAQVLAARTLVARWRGERDAARHLPARPAHPIPVRPGDATIVRHRRAMRRGLALATLAIVAGLVLAPLAGWIAGAALLPLVAALGTTRASQLAAQRLEQQRVAARFLRPVVK